MKIVFCFFLLFNICHCNKDSDGSANCWSKHTRINDGIYRGDNKYDDHQNRGYYHTSIIRPCSLHDLNCIRQFFAHSAKCSPVEGQAPDPYLLQRLDLRIPHANITFSLINAQVKGLNEWKINKFFINKATDRLVLEVVFDRIVVSSPGVIIRYHRKGKEPLEVSDYSIIEYYGVSFTLTIPHIRDLQLSKSHVYSYIPDAAPNYTLGPAIYSSKDPGFILAIRELGSKLGLSIQEVFVNQGSTFLSVFLQNTICNFKQH